MDAYEDDREDEADEDLTPDALDLTTDEDRVAFYRDGVCVVRIQRRAAPRKIRETGTRTLPAEPGELSDAAMWRQLDAYFKKERITARVFEVDEGGTATLMAPPKRKQSTHARARLDAAVAAATKRYGEDGPLIAGGSGIRANWPQRVQAKLGKLAARR